MGMPAGQETRQHHPCRSCFWSRAAAHRLAQALHAWVPLPALTLRTTNFLRTVEHGHACSPGDTSAPSLQILILEKSSSAPSCSGAARPGPPTCAVAAHHRSPQDSGAWACLLARRHVSTISADPDFGAEQQRTVLLRRCTLGSPRLRRRCAPPGLFSTVEHGHACWPGDTSAPSLQILILEKSSSAPSCSGAARPGPPACADAAHQNSPQDRRAWACLLARKHVSTIPSGRVVGAEQQHTVLLRRYTPGSPCLR